MSSTITTVLLLLPLLLIIIIIKKIYIVPHHTAKHFTITLALLQYTHTCIQACVHMCTHRHTHTHMFKYTRAHTYAWYACIYRYIQIYIYACVCTVRRCLVELLLIQYFQPLPVILSMSASKSQRFHHDNECPSAICLFLFTFSKHWVLIVIIQGTAV